MILSGKEIEKHMGKEIVIEPYDPKRLNPNSYNLSLHHELLVYENRQLDMKMPNPVKKLTIPKDGLLLEPGRLYLGRTNEFTKTDRFVPMLEGCLSMSPPDSAMWVSPDTGPWKSSAYSLSAFTPAWKSAKSIITTSTANMNGTAAVNIKTILEFSQAFCIRILKSRFL